METEHEEQMAKLGANEIELDGIQAEFEKLAEESDHDTPIGVTRFHTFIHAEEVKRQALEVVEACKKIQAELQGWIIEELSAGQGGSFSSGGYNLRPVRKLWVKAKKRREDGSGGTDDVVAALRGCGRDDMVSSGYNAASLKSLIQEMLDGNQPIPPALDQVIDRGYSDSVVATKR